VVDLFIFFICFVCVVSVFAVGPPGPTLFPYTTLFRSRSFGCGHARSLGPWELERAERVERLVVGEIEVDRRDRDEAVAHGVEIGALGILERELVAADPVVLLAARIDLLDDGVPVAPPPHARQGEAADGLAVERC